MDSLGTKLFKILNLNGVRYCHWKSNIDLRAAINGDGDLDILVDRRDKIHFDALVMGLGFKRANSRWERQFPGMEDYAGWDDELDILVHLHVHYQLVLGATYAKSLHLPIERHYLQETFLLGDVRVPERENELLVFLFRHTLKIRIYDLLRNRRVKDQVVAELDYLAHDLRLERIESLLKVIGLSSRLFWEMQDVLREGRPIGVLWTKIKLQREMRDRHRLEFGSGVVRPLVARGQFHVDSLRGAFSQGKMPSSGGALIALIGSDGAGKSTTVAALEAWLKQFYSVSVFHMGKPRQDK